MKITTISFSYFFLAVAIISFIFSVYFLVITKKTSEDSNSRDEIVGSMKDPDNWRSRNKKMGYINLCFFIISIGAFIYFKFFSVPSLINLIYLFVFLGIIVISLFVILIANKKVPNK